MAKRRPSAPFGKRIIRTGDVPAGQLLANANNFRIHPRAQQDALQAVLNEIGFVQHVMVNVRSSSEWGASRDVETLVDGHARVEQALARGEETPVPVVYVDLSPAEERRVLATFDAIGAMAAIDGEKLDELLKESVDDFPESAVDLAAILKRETRNVTFEASTSANVLVECATSDEQVELLEELGKRGFRCKATSRS